MERQIIKSFRSEKYQFLSNGYGCFVTFEVLRYPSVDHAFQAAKTRDSEERKNFTVMDSAKTAIYWGKKLDLRSDWEDVKVDIMAELLRSKFSNPTLKQKLLDTDDALIIASGDRFWGQVNGEGENTLGILLMKVREELKA